MKLLREPLLHFFFAGAAMFAAYALLNHGEKSVDADNHLEVRINEGHLRWVTETWSRQWQREPSHEELRGLIQDLVKEELLAREARELELDKDDTIVRRRLAQKMKFLVEDTSSLAEPTDDELRQLYDAHPEKFRRETRVSFVHVYFSGARRVDAAADAQEALVELASLDGGEPSADKGDQLLIEPHVNDADESTVAAHFGREFALRVFALVPGAWHGPIESPYGLHLVRVSEITPAEQRPFLRVRTEVIEYWREERRRQDEQRYFAELFKKYKIVTDESVKALIGPLSLEAEQAQ